MVKHFVDHPNDDCWVTLFPNQTAHKSLVDRLIPSRANKRKHPSSRVCCYSVGTTTLKQHKPILIIINNLLIYLRHKTATTTHTAHNGNGFQKSVETAQTINIKVIYFLKNSLITFYETRLTYKMPCFFRVCVNNKKTTIMHRNSNNNQTNNQYQKFYVE